MGPERGSTASLSRPQASTFRVCRFDPDRPESLLRNCDGKRVTEHAVKALASWKPKDSAPRRSPLSSRGSCSRTSPVFRSWSTSPRCVRLWLGREEPEGHRAPCPRRLGRRPFRSGGFRGQREALAKNLAIEFQRNRERYQFLKWGMQAFETFKVVPPGIGIVHQVNLEFLARGCSKDWWG